jgi:hypothetical protein
MMKFVRRYQRHLLIAVVFGLAVAGSIEFAAAPPAFEVDWWTVDSGGAQELSGGVFTLNSTTGQPDAGKLSGGPFVLYGGFWLASFEPTVVRHWQLYR